MKILSQHKSGNELISVCIPETENDFEKYFQLRWEILRKRWNRPKGSEQDEGEKTSFHFALLNEKKEFIGTCRLQLNSEEESQVRSMCVRNDYQGKQLGNLLIQAAEQKAKTMNAKSIVLHARENALNFYKRNGYLLVKKSYVLFDVIQHYEMRKKIK
jgi:predicted GNAT family N-acyltransferase